MANIDDLLFEAGIDLDKFQKDKQSLIKEVLGMDEEFKKGGDGIINAFNRAISNQKSAIKDIEAELKRVYAEADKMAPGQAQANVLGEAKKIEGDLGLAKQQADDMAKLRDEFKMTDVAVTKLSTKFNEAKNRLAELNLANKQGTPEYTKAEAEVRKYGTALDDANKRAIALTKGSLGGLAQGMSLVTGSMATVTSLMGVFGAKNEDLNGIMLKTQALLSATVTLQEIKNTAVQKGGVISGIMAVQEMARARAADLAAAGTVRATIAQRAFNLVATANPYVLLAAAIISVVGAIALYVSSTNAAEANTKKLIDLNKRVADSVAEPLVSYKKLQAQWNALGNDLKAKEKYVKDNKEEFKKLGVEVNNVTDAENVLVGNTAAFVQSMMLKAKATAMQQKAVEDTRKSLEMEAEYRRKYIDNDLTAGEQILMSTQAAKRANAKIEAEKIRKLNQGIYDDSVKQLDVEKKIAEIGKKAGFKTPTKQEKEEKKGKGIGKRSVKDVADEYLPPGSVAEIQKRLSEIDKALAKSNNDDSTKLLKSRRIAVALELAAAEKKIRIKTFDEEMADTKKQIELRDKLLQAGYSKEKVDSMLPEVKDKSYIGYLEETEKSLKNLINAGDNTEQTATNLTNIQQVISEFNGYSTFVDDVAKSLENLKSKFSGSELIAELEKYKNVKLPDATEAESNARKLAAQKEIEAQQQALKDQYAQFLKEHQSFEEQKKAITDKYDDLRKSATSGKEISIIDKAQAEELSKLSLEVFKSSADWQMAFGDMEYVSQTALKRIEEGLLEFKRVKGETLQPTELRELEEALKRVREAQSSNPFTSLIGSMKNLKAAKDEVYFATERYNAAVRVSGKDSTEAAQASKDLADADMKQAEAKKKLVADIQKAQNIFNAVGEGVMELGDMFGGFDDATNDAIGNIMAIGNAAMDLGKSIASGDVAGMIKAGVKLISSVFKALNGDQKKEREIKKQAAALKELEKTYNDLGRAIDKALGEKFFDASAAAVNNLKQQKALLEQMMRTEQSKKKADQEKINGYKDQINSISNAIEDMQQKMVDKALNGINAQGLADKLADALTTAFQNGESAAEAMGKTVDEVLRDMVKNALKMKLLEPAMQAVVDKMLTSMGFNQVNNSAQINSVQQQIAALQQEYDTTIPLIDATRRAQLLAQINALKAQMTALQNGQSFSGSFDGLTQAERDEIKAMMEGASNNYMNALSEYEQLFGAAAENAAGLKGSIKGITEKTADVLAGQMNAIRINQGESLKNQKAGNDLIRTQLLHLSQIEQNTRPTKGVYEEMYDLNRRLKAKGF